MRLNAICRFCHAIISKAIKNIRNNTAIIGKSSLSLNSYLIGEFYYFKLFSVVRSDIRSS